MKYSVIIILLVFSLSVSGYVSNSTLKCGVDGWDWESPGEIVLYNVTDLNMYESEVIDYACNKSYAFQIAYDNRSLFDCAENGTLYDCVIDSSNSSESSCYSFYDDLILCSNATTTTTSTSSTVSSTSSTVVSGSTSSSLPISGSYVVVGTTIPGMSNLSSSDGLDNFPTMENKTYNVSNPGSLPNTSEGLGNRSGLPGNVGGIGIEWFFKGLAILIVTIVSLSFRNVKLSIAAGVVSLDFMIIIGGFLVVPLSVLLFFHVLMAMAFLGGRS